MHIQGELLFLNGDDEKYFLSRYTNHVLIRINELTEDDIGHLKSVSFALPVDFKCARKKYDIIDTKVAQSNKEGNCIFFSQNQTSS